MSVITVTQLQVKLRRCVYTKPYRKCRLIRWMQVLLFDLCLSSMNEYVTQRSLEQNIQCYNFVWCWTKMPFSRRSLLLSLSGFVSTIIFGGFSSHESRSGYINKYTCKCAPCTDMECVHVILLLLLWNIFCVGRNTAKLQKMFAWFSHFCSQKAVNKHRCDRQRGGSKPDRRSQYLTELGRSWRNIFKEDTLSHDRLFSGKAEAAAFSYGTSEDRSELPSRRWQLPVALRRACGRGNTASP